jgi:zinc/manganese transport system substrate-binding protein
MFCCLGLPLTAPAKLNVVATTPDLGSIAREIGGDQVAVTVLAKPTEDPHFVDPKPSFLVTLNKADALIEDGADLDVGYMPPLLGNARNGKIMPGKPGNIQAAEGVQMREVPGALDRRFGDVHPKGNPHFVDDPVVARIIAEHLAESFAQLDPRSRDAYKANLASFESTLDVKFKQWEEMLSPYKGAKLVTYHKDMTYFAERFGFEVIDTLEPLPGVSPSPSHLAEVIEKMKAEHAKVILVQPFQNRKTAETVANHVGAKVVDFPLQPGTTKATGTYFQWMDLLIGSLAHALSETK